MNKRALFVLIFAGLGLLVNHVAAQTVDVVNMIPSTLSGESNQDSEPDLTVNPHDPDEIIASAFTPNPSGGTATAPVYCSQDGGATWVLNNIVPSANGMTADITVALTRNNVLYAGILRGGGVAYDMRILRGGTCPTAGTMIQLLGRTNEDQPYARAYTPMGGPQRNNDHLYVGHNDFNNAPQTASFEQSLNAATAPAPAGLGTIRLERRTPSGQDGPPIRQAIHPRGTVYAVYTQRTASAGSIRTGNVVVVRDNDWGQGATPYADVTDPGDAIAGRIVVNGVSWVWNSGSAMGQERLGDRAAIAVDPTDDSTVYVAWADRPAGVTGNTATLHVRRSTNGGNNWSADLRTINGAINPQLAINIRGDVGFLFQQLTGTGTAQRWETHFQQLDNGATAWTDFTLADVPANTPVRAFGPYIGDYVGLTAVGKDFYGVFSANNTPDNANFPNGVTYQRNANFTTNTLTDGTGSPVPVSIDPFFFHVRNLADNLDFYVRDWTANATDNDEGLEPSTNPVFYQTSDVWNRRSNNSGGFTANDQPISQDPQVSSAGDNFGFARVHRKATGSVETVTLHFLKSEFGTGSNYQNAGATADPTLNFGAGVQVRTLSSGYRWTLTATSSSHTCLAVEISTPNDPIVQPSLLGRAPGWPDTDLMVIYDNNKAQRNMGVYSGSGDGSSISYHALVHNAATRYRDMIIDIRASKLYAELVGEPRLRVVGDGEARFQDGRLVLLGMAPGENRWVTLTVPATPNLPEDELMMVDFHEMRGNLPINGFAIAQKRVPIEHAGVEGLRLLAGNLHRMGSILQRREATELSRDLLSRVQEEKIEPTVYLELVTSILKPYREMLEEALRRGRADPFGLAVKLDTLELAVRSENPRAIYPRQSNLDHAVDAYLTYVDKQRGDVADVAQNMRWQADLFESVRGALQVEGVRELARLSERFDAGYASRRLGVADYAELMKGSLPTLRRLNERLQLGQAATLRRIEASLEDHQALQKAHWEFLLRLERLR